MLEIQAIQKSASTTNGHVVSDPVFCVTRPQKIWIHWPDFIKKNWKLLLSKAQKPIYFPSLSCSSQPLLFRAISQIYRTILDFGDAGDTSVKKVCIVCEDDDIRNTYMVVWNFYYAGTKKARMNDGRWD